MGIKIKPIDWQYNYNGWHAGLYKIYIHLKDGAADVFWNEKVIAKRLADSDAAQAAAYEHKTKLILAEIEVV